MEVLWLEMNFTSISSFPVCVTLTTSPEASDTYSKLCADPLHFPSVCTPFLRNSGGVGSRTAFGLARLKVARITAQSAEACKLSAELARSGASGALGFGGWQGSLRRYSDSVRQNK